MSNLLKFPQFPQPSVERAPLAAVSGEPRAAHPWPRQMHSSKPLAEVSTLRSPPSPPPSREKRDSNSGSSTTAPPAAPHIDEDRLAGIAASVGQAALEVLGGSRPLKQMSPWLDAVSLERLQARAALVDNYRRRAPGKAGLRLHRGITVRSTRLCKVRDGAYEASLVVSEQTRVRALALRLEMRRGNWKVTALEIG